MVTDHLLTGMILQRREGKVEKGLGSYPSPHRRVRNFSPLSTVSCLELMVNVETQARHAGKWWWWWWWWWWWGWWRSLIAGWEATPDVHHYSHSCYSAGCAIETPYTLEGLLASRFAGPRHEIRTYVVKQPQLFLFLFRCEPIFRWTTTRCPGQEGAT